MLKPRKLHLSIKLPRLIEAKIKYGIFIRSQIRKLVMDRHFNNILKSNEKLI